MIVRDVNLFVGRNYVVDEARLIVRKRLSTSIIIIDAFAEWVHFVLFHLVFFDVELKVHNHEVRDLFVHYDSDIDLIQFDLHERRFWILGFLRYQNVADIIVFLQNDHVKQKDWCFCSSNAAK